MPQPTERKKDATTGAQEGSNQHHSAILLMTSYEDRINEVLQTLIEIKAGRTDTLTATFWEAKYQQDVTFLLKTLAERNARLRTLNARVEDVRKILDKATK